MNESSANDLAKRIANLSRYYQFSTDKLGENIKPAVQESYKILPRSYTARGVCPCLTVKITIGDNVQRNKPLLPDPKE